MSFQWIKQHFQVERFSIKNNRAYFVLLSICTIFARENIIDNRKAMTLKEFFSFRSNRFLWGNLLAMVLVVVAIGWGALKGIDIYTRHGEAVAVPNIKGMGLVEATKMLRNSGLVGMVADSTYRSEERAGCVLECNPPAGQRVKQGRTVYLTVNAMSTPLQEVPDVADNSSLRQARARLLAAGFQLDENDSIPGERDWVYGVKYQGRMLQEGEKVPMGSCLTLIVGDGGGELPSDSTAVETPEGQEKKPAQSATEEESWF